MPSTDLRYPRPDFNRSARWVSLDGPWDFARADTWDEKLLDPQCAYPESIIVPFPWESEASEVRARWLQYGWYRRTVTIPRSWHSERIILHFGGVHHRASVFLDGRLIGEHEGAGPFECDITDALAGTSATIIVAVGAPNDKRQIGHGKQRSLPADDYDSCAFEPSSGIWQPVWLEPRPATFLRSLRLDSAEGLDALVAQAVVDGPSREGARLRLAIRGMGAAAETELNADGRAQVRLPVEHARLWCPEDPHLYMVEATLSSQDGRDQVVVPAGLRRIEVVGDELRLNGRRLYLRGVLDQGYWPRSGLSAPSPQALSHDLELARAAGYNLVRKHLKLEDPRWLHAADRMGVLVWEEPPSTGRYSAGSVAAFRQQVEAMVARDANHPAIVMWGLFNEEWGLDWAVAADPGRQQDVRETVALLRSLDHTRPIVDNSGWSHVTTDIVDWHYYEHNLSAWAKNAAALVNDENAMIPVALQPPALETKPLAIASEVVRGRPNMNSEYGAGLTSIERGWHLKWQTQELRRHDRLSGYVYTELYDIEHEFAGLFTADRRPKDLGNLELDHVNAETVLILDVDPKRPGTDLEVAADGQVAFAVRLSHHGHQAVSGRLRATWGPHFAPGPRFGPSTGTSGVRTLRAEPVLHAEPFILSPPVPVEAELPSGWRAGRLHLWLETEGAVLAATSLDVVKKAGNSA